MQPFVNTSTPERTSRSDPSVLCEIVGKSATFDYPLVVAFRRQRLAAADVWCRRLPSFLFLLCLETSCCVDKVTSIIVVVSSFPGMVVYVVPSDVCFSIYKFGVFD